MKKRDEITKEHKEEQQKKRRTFLKKAAYSAPVLLALGQLSKPTKAHADSGAPVGPPAWGGF